MKRQSQIDNLITSWDDGHPLDLKVADLLKKNKIKGTFYVPLKNSQREVMTKSQIRQLGTEFEIGAHTYSHIDLTSIPLGEAEWEIRKGKEELESILGKPVVKFAYPYGHFNQKIENIVKKIGFKSARSARLINFHKSGRTFHQDPNLHFYNHSLIVYVAHCIRNRDISTLSSLLREGSWSLPEIAKSLSKDGFHLWGHSWEVEEKQMWGELNDLVKLFADKN